MDDVDQMEWNEYQRLQRAIEARQKRIVALESGTPDIVQRNFRYVLDYTFDFTEYPTLPPSQTRTFIVKSETEGKRKTRFYVKSLEINYAVLASPIIYRGPFQDPVIGEGQRFFIAPDYRRYFFDFTWRIKDTGSDREWQNTDMPSQLLMTGNVNPLLLGNGHCMLSGGTEVSMQIDPTFSGLIIENEGNARLAFTNPISHFVQISFVGVEVVL